MSWYLGTLRPNQNKPRWTLKAVFVPNRYSQKKSIENIQHVNSKLMVPLKKNNLNF